MALFDRLCSALECLLLWGKADIGQHDRGMTVGLFIASADRSDGGVASNAKVREISADPWHLVTSRLSGDLNARLGRQYVPG
jgi:hypothetical protein